MEKRIEALEKQMLVIQKQILEILKNGDKHVVITKEILDMQIEELKRKRCK